MLRQAMDGLCIPICLKQMQVDQHEQTILLMLISRCCDLQLQHNINQSLQIECGVAILTNHRNFPANLTKIWRCFELTSTNYLPSYFRVYYVQAIQAFMQHVHVQRFTLADQNNCERSRKAVSWYST